MLAEKQFLDKKLEVNYNFGPDDESYVSTGALVELFCEAWGGDICWKTRENSGTHEANFLKLDCSKAKAVLGWKPRWDIKLRWKRLCSFPKLVLIMNESFVLKIR